MRSKVFLILCLALASTLTSVCGFTSKEVKCQVCRITVKEMEKAVSKVDPNKLADVSGFRLDADGNTKVKQVQLAKSEMYLTELMENICDRMEDYVKATYKDSGKLIVMPLLVGGGMNPLASQVDFVQDGDLNKSLNHYCLEVLDDYEKIFLKGFQEPTLDSDLDLKLCTQCCGDAPIQEDYQFDEEKDEL